MDFNLSVESLTISIGVLTLIVGVINSIYTNKQTIKSQHLQIILTISESFRNKWEENWKEILDGLEVDHISPRTKDIPPQNIDNISYMLNWVDWMGAMKTSGALSELEILTSSIGIPIKRIINAGYPILKHDTEKHGVDYWKNLFTVAEHLKISHVVKLKHNAPN